MILQVMMLVVIVIIWIMRGWGLATCCRRFAIVTSIVIWIQSRSFRSLGIRSIGDRCWISSGSVSASKRLNALVCCFSYDIFEWLIQSCAMLRIRGFRMWCRVVLWRGNFCGGSSLIGNRWCRGASLRAHIVLTVHANASWASRFIWLAYAITLLCCRFMAKGAMMIWVHSVVWNTRLVGIICVCWDLLRIQ